MRISVTIPDEYYEKIKGTLQINGYTTLSDYILDLIRKHQSGAEQKEEEFYDNSNSEELIKENNEHTLKMKTYVDNLQKPLAPPEPAKFINITKEDIQNGIDSSAIPTLPNEWGSTKAYCHFCNNKPARMMSYKYVDGSGEGETFFCKQCWDRYEGKQDLSTDLSTYTPAKKADMQYFHPMPKPVKKKK